MDTATDSSPYDPSLIPLSEKNENKQKEAGVGPFKKDELQLFGSSNLALLPKSC